MDELDVADDFDPVALPELEEPELEPLLLLLPD